MPSGSRQRRALVWASSLALRGGRGCHLRKLSRWATCKQIKDMGGQVRKGEKATRVGGRRDQKRGDGVRFRASHWVTLK